MSKPVKVAFVMEGSTDYVVLRAAVRALLNGRDFEPTSVWPILDSISACGHWTTVANGNMYSLFAMPRSGESAWEITGRR